MKYIEPIKFHMMFKKFLNKHWNIDKRDRAYGNIYYSIIDGVYVSLDCEGNEVYVEEFNDNKELFNFYGYKPFEQLTLF